METGYKNGKKAIYTLFYEHRISEARIVSDEQKFSKISFPSNCIGISITNLPGSTDAVQLNSDNICPGGNISIHTNEGGFLRVEDLNLKWDGGTAEVSVVFHTMENPGYKLIPVIE